jgi:hypothetical protein
MGIPLLEETNPASCFPRLAVGYESVCYSYVWSQVQICYRTSDTKYLIDVFITSIV